MKKAACLFLALIFFSSFSVLAFEPYQGYTYDEWDTGIPSANGYNPTAVYIGDADNKTRFNMPKDLTVDEAGRIFILNSGSNGIVILNKDFSLVREIKSFLLPDGSSLLLSDARSIVAKNGKLVVADFENMNIIVSDYEGRIAQEITIPTNPVFPQDKEFRPYGVSIDEEGNIYALINEIYQGVALFSPQGEFKGFFANNKVSPTLSVLVDRFWKTFMGAEARSQMANYVPVISNNIDVTKDGFVYSCTGSSSYGESNLRCFNPFGVDVWKSEKNAGDLEYAVRKEKSYKTEFIDISAAESGFVYALDSTMNRVFMFDPEHNMVFPFGGFGNQKGTFTQPVALETFERTVYVLDSKKETVTVFEPTEYGNKVMDALELNAEGQYDKSMNVWTEVLRSDGNVQDAYVGIGKALLYSGQYQNSMTYFREGSDRPNESKAFELYRSQILRRFFPNIMIGVFITLVGIFVILVIRKTRISKNKPSIAVAGQWKAFSRTLFHPFDSFEEIRYKKSGSVWIAGLFIFMFFIATLFERHTLAFRFNQYSVENTNALLIFASTVLVVCIGVVTNWGISTLWDGKANMRLIWIVFGYALCPYVCGMLLRIAFSHILIVDESALLNMISTLSAIWSGLLLWFGILQSQDFTISKNILCMLCTLAGMVLVTLLCFLVILLFQELFSFIGSFTEELLLRIGGST